MSGMAGGSGALCGPEVLRGAGVWALALRALALRALALRALLGALALVAAGGKLGGAAGWSLSLTAGRLTTDSVGPSACGNPIDTHAQHRLPGGQQSQLEAGGCAGAGARGCASAGGKMGGAAVWSLSRTAGRLATDSVGPSA